MVVKYGELKKSKFRKFRRKCLGKLRDIEFYWICLLIVNIAIAISIGTITGLITGISSATFLVFWWIIKTGKMGKSRLQNEIAQEEWLWITAGWEDTEREWIKQWGDELNKKTMSLWDEGVSEVELGRWKNQQWRQLLKEKWDNWLKLRKQKGMDDTPPSHLFLHNPSGFR